MHIEGEEVKNAEDLNVRLPEGGTRWENVKEHECCFFFFPRNRQVNLQADSSVLLIDIQN